MDAASTSPEGRGVAAASSGIIDCCCRCRRRCCRSCRCCCCCRCGADKDSEEKAEDDDDEGDDKGDLPTTSGCVARPSKGRFLWCTFPVVVPFLERVTRPGALRSGESILVAVGSSVELRTIVPARCTDISAPALRVRGTSFGPALVRLVITERRCGGGGACSAISVSLLGVFFVRMCSQWDGVVHRGGEGTVPRGMVARASRAARPPPCPPARRACEVCARAAGARARAWAPG